MSFFTEITARRLGATASAVTRRTASASAPVTMPLRHQQAAAISVSAARPKTATEAAKDTLKTVDRVVSDKLVDGIDMGANVAGKVKKAAEDLTEGKRSTRASAKAQDVKDGIVDKAQELGARAQDKAQEWAAGAQDKAKEYKADAQDKAQDWKADAKAQTRQAADTAADKAQEAADAVKKRV